MYPFDICVVQVYYKETVLYPFVDIREETSILEHFYKETVLYPFVDLREETSILEHFIRRLCYTPVPSVLYPYC